MKTWRWKKILPKALLFLIAASFYSNVVCAEDTDNFSESTSASTQDIELADYTDGDGIQTYASTLTGKVNNIVIFIRFADHDEYVTANGMQNAQKIFNEGSLSLKEYINRISYGEVTVDTAFYPQNGTGCYSVQISENADYFKKQYTDESGQLTDGYTNEDERRKREEELIAGAVNGVQDQIAASGLDLDLDRDGFVDGISFVTSIKNPNTENVGYGDLLWAHKSELNTQNVMLNNLKIGRYNLMERGTDNTGVLGSSGNLARTVKHEFLHTLSLPDLYRYNDSSAKTLGPWDIMDQGNAANITAWYQREYLEFGDRLPVYDTTTKGITLQTAKYQDPHEVYAVVLKSKQNKDEYFVVEHREQEEENYDQKNKGLLVYRISESLVPSSQGNAAGPPDFIYAFRPGEVSANSGKGKIEYATLSPGNPEGFTSLGKPLGMENPDYDNGTLYYTNGRNSGIVIDNLVENVDGSMTFDVTFPEDLKGNGTKENPYEIRTIQDLYALYTASSGTYYKLTNDLDASNYDFLPIPSFKGILDGNQKTISNLKISGKNASGFIVDVYDGAEIKNLTFTNPVITSSNDYAAIFSNVQGTVENVCIDGGTITSKEGSISSRAGGLAGALNSPGVIRNCYTSASVSANHAGGLVSYINGGEITGSYACGQVNGLGKNAVTGGIFAYWSKNQAGKLQNTYWDTQGTDQTTNGLVWEDNSSANLSGVLGIAVECPDSITQGSSGKAKIVSANGTVSLSAVWESDAPSIISINASTGELSGKSKGTATISVRFPVGNYSGVLSKEVVCQGSTNVEKPDEEKPGGDAENPITGGKWIASGSRWWYRKADGSYPANGIYNINGSYFAFDTSGWMVTGWYYRGGGWYYFNGSGYMQKGWLRLGGTWYYLSPSDGRMYGNGIYAIGNSSFAFNGSGAMVTSWYYRSGSWYYFNGGGYMQKGWLRLGSTWYYLNPSDGRMYGNGMYTIGGSSFAFNGSGAMVTGWYYRSGNWYYFNGSGYMQKGWLRLGSIWYYLNPENGQMYGSGIRTIDGRKSSFDSSGKWLGYVN